MTTTSDDVREELRPAAQAQAVAEELEDEDAELEAVELPLWQPTLRVRIREAWHSRHLLPGLARSAVPTHQGKILGRAWHIIRPLWQIFGFAVIFGGIFHAKAPNGIPYLLFVVFSFQAFQLFQIAVMYETVGARQIKVARNLRVPLLLIPFATLGRVFVRMGVYWAVAVILLVYFLIAKGHFYLQLNQRLVIGIAGVALALAFGVALGLITSVLYSRAKDVRYLVRYSMQIWMFFTPVFYSIHQLPPTYRSIAQFNPLTGIVSMVQYGFLGASGIRLFGVLWSLGSLAVTAAFGLWFFNRFATRWIGVYRVTEGDDGEDEEML